MPSTSWLRAAGAATAALVKKLAVKKQVGYSLHVLPTPHMHTCIHTYIQTYAFVKKLAVKKLAGGHTHTHTLVA